MRWVGHVLDSMLDYVLDQVLDQPTISLVTTALW